MHYRKKFEKKTILKQIYTGLDNLHRNIEKKISESGKRKELTY